MFHPEMALQMARQDHAARLAAAEHYRLVREARAARHEHTEPRLVSLVKRLRKPHQNAEQPLVAPQPPLLQPAAR